MSDNQEPIVGEIEVHGGLPIQLPSNPFESGISLWTSWDKTDKGGASKVGKCLRQADMTCETDPDVLLQVEDVALHIVHLQNHETGEVVLAQRTVLLCADGRTYSTVSPYAVVGLAAVAECFGQPPWPGGVGVRCTLTKTRKGRRVLTMTPED